MARAPTLVSTFSTGSLKLKLTLSTAALLTMTCLVFGGLFVQQQVASVTAGLLDSGALLAQHVARTSRHATLTADTLALSRLIRETLALPHVDYVAIVAPKHQIELGAGKGAWGHQFTKMGLSRQRFSLSGLLLPRFVEHPTAEPLVTAVSLTEGSPILRPHLFFNALELAGIFSGAEYPVVADVIVPIPGASLAVPPDSALGLMLDEPALSVTDPTGPDVAPRAFVHVGLSTAELQDTLRRVIRQIALVTFTLLTLALGGALWLAHRMTTPLQALTTAAQRIAGGEPFLPVPSSGHDEIGTLTGMFNQMVEILQTRERELRELTHTLEDRVRVRTEELESANAKLQELDRRKSLFVSTASHELRTPLTSIRLNLANLRDEVYGTLEPEQCNVLNRLEGSLGRLQHLIEELLDLSRIEVGEIALRLKSMDLPPVIIHVADTLHALAADKHVTVATDVATGLPPVFADAEKVQQILTNLIHNAVKFSPADGTVTVGARPNGNGTVHVSVGDHGIGIAPDDLDKIFLPFYRSARPGTQAKGAGLGLTIAKHLVELHKGRLWVESRPGEGSTFSFTLPIA